MPKSFSRWPTKVAFRVKRNGECFIVCDCYFIGVESKLQYDIYYIGVETTLECYCSFQYLGEQ
jgi:hypothetical protein